MSSRAEQKDLPKGYTIIESTHAILGTGTDKKVAIRGGDHPKMRLLVSDVNTLYNDGEGFSEDWSFVLVNTACTSGVVTVGKRDGTVAGRTGAMNLANEIHPLAAIAPSATQNVSQTFEADEDVIIEPSTVLGAAAGAVIAVLKFKVVD